MSPENPPTHSPSAKDAKPPGAVPPHAPPKPNAASAGSSAPRASGTPTPPPTPEQRAAELEDDLKRLAAEFDNFRKRTMREKEQARTDGRLEVLRSLLTLCDEFEAARTHSVVADEADLRKGIELMDKKLHSTLVSLGAKPIPCEGVPDHRYHEAMLTVVGEPHGHICQVLRQGWMSGDQVLRPAQVSVYAEAQADAAPAQRADPASDGSPSDAPASSMGDGERCEAVARLVADARSFSRQRNHSKASEFVHLAERAAKLVKDDVRRADQMEFVSQAKKELNIH